MSGGGGRRAKFYWGMSQIQPKATPLEFSYRESINYIPRLSRILLHHLLHSVLLSAPQLGSDELCFFSGLIFYSFILKSFTYYSFYPAHYSLIYSTYYINVRNLYNTELYNLINTTVSRFTRDTLINAHDTYMTVEFYLTYV